MRKSGIIFIAKEPLLTDSQLDKLADILIAAGQLATGLMVLPYVFPELDKGRLAVVILGLTATFISWTASVLIVRRLK